MCILLFLYLLTFWVTPKVFTPCLGAFHEIWGTWCMISPSMVCDGFSHGIWSMMDFRAVSPGAAVDLNCVLACYSSLGCWGSSNKFGDILHDDHMGMLYYLESSLLRKRSIMHPLEGY
jgi:hypothetical protein